MNEMFNHNTENNADDGTRTNNEDISLGGCPIAQQDWIGRHPITVRARRRKLSHEVNTSVINVIIEVISTITGYRKTTTTKNSYDLK